jgi:hypothetical protein
MRKRTQAIDQGRINNFHRALAAGIANAELARTALDLLGDDCPTAWRRVAGARIGDPVASWGQIAMRLGITKDMAAGYFRRMLEKAGLLS